jgi:hypothetical protein
MNVHKENDDDDDDDKEEEEEEEKFKQRQKQFSTGFEKDIQHPFLSHIQTHFHISQRENE